MQAHDIVMVRMSKRLVIRKKKGGHTMASALVCAALGGPALLVLAIILPLIASWLQREMSLALEFHLVLVYFTIGMGGFSI